MFLCKVQTITVTYDINCYKYKLYVTHVKQNLKQNSADNQKHQWCL